jgi:hypothetical protein
MSRIVKAIRKRPWVFIASILCLIVELVLGVLWYRGSTGVDRYEPALAIFGLLTLVFFAVFGIPSWHELFGRNKDENPDIDEWKKIISEVFYCLEHCARWYGNIGSGRLNDMKKAYDALQQSAHRLIASANTLNCPIDRSRVEEAKALLLGISNTLIDGNILAMQQNRGYVSDPEESEARRRQSRENRENAEKIKRLLGLSQK